MTKHTPGPWQRPKTNGETIIVGGDYADEGEPDLIITVQSSSNELNQLNAHLIAAAPELYEACKEFVRKCECGEARSHRSYAQMKAALAKAEGVPD